MEGWIKIDRRILDWEWFDDSCMVHLFLFLLVSANHEDDKWRGIVVKRGQLVTGLESLSEHTNLSKQKIRTCIAKLEKSGEIIKKSTNKYSIITICNYDKYQDENLDSNKQTTNKQQTNNNKQEYIYNNSIDITPNVVISKSKTRSQKNKPARVGKNGQVEMFGEDEWKKPAQQKKEFIPPTLDEVVDFFILNNGTREQAEAFFYTFDGIGWKNTKGVKITRWESRAKQWIIQDKNQNSVSHGKDSKFKSVDERSADAKSKRDQEFASHIAQLIANGDKGEDASPPW